VVRELKKVYRLATSDKIKKRKGERKKNKASVGNVGQDKKKKKTKWVKSMEKKEENNIKEGLLRGGGKKP